MKPNKTSPPITVTQAFDLTTDALWELVSAPGNLNDAHPFCKTNEALTWDGNEHVDRLGLPQRAHLRSEVSDVEPR